MSEDSTEEGADAMRYLSAWRKQFVHAEWSANGQGVTFNDFDTTSVDSALRNADLLPTVGDMLDLVKELEDVSEKGLEQVAHPLCLRPLGRQEESERGAFDAVTEALLERADTGNTGEADVDASLVAFEGRLQQSIETATAFLDTIKDRKPTQEAAIREALDKAAIWAKNAEAEQRRSAR